jgi:hypothetical protein
MTDVVWKNHDTFEVATRNGAVEFQTMENGRFWVGVEAGHNRELFNRSTEQFQSFQQWSATHNR